MHKTDSRPTLTFILIISVCLGLAHFLPLPEAPEPSLEPLPAAPVTNVITEDIPDFASINNVQEKKATFFNFLMPIVEELNNDILLERQRLQNLQQKVVTNRTLSKAEKAYVDQVSKLYEVQPQQAYSVNHFRQLLRRVDIIPMSMVLAQAANESAWGTSRFAVEGKNFFGQWCYSKGCGIVPNLRRNGATHEVKAFDNVADSVKAYFMNINTFPSYRNLRVMRQGLREDHQIVDGISLSVGLRQYSERGEAYIDELQSMIYSNDLHELDF